MTLAKFLSENNMFYEQFESGLKEYFVTEIIGKFAFTKICSVLEMTNSYSSDSEVFFQVLPNANFRKYEMDYSPRGTLRNKYPSVR